MYQCFRYATCLLQVTLQHYGTMSGRVLGGQVLAVVFGLSAVAL